MTSHQKLLISYERLQGEYAGTLKAILWWDIPEELKVRLQKRIKELEAIPPYFQVEN